MKMFLGDVRMQLPQRVMVNRWINCRPKVCEHPSSSQSPRARRGRHLERLGRWHGSGQPMELPVPIRHYDQWPFQEAQLEVPSIYKASVAPFEDLEVPTKIWFFHGFFIFIWFLLLQMFLSIFGRRGDGWIFGEAAGGPRWTECSFGDWWKKLMVNRGKWASKCI